MYRFIGFLKINLTLEYRSLDFTLEESPKKSKFCPIKLKKFRNFSVKPSQFSTILEFSTFIALKPDQTGSNTI